MIINRHSDRKQNVTVAGGFSSLIAMELIPPIGDIYSRALLSHGGVTSLARGPRPGRRSSGR